MTEHGKPGLNDVPYRIARRSATTMNTDIDPPRPTYETGRDTTSLLYPKMRFWDSEDRYLITIDDIVDQVRLDNDGNEFGGKLTKVVVESDHPKHREGPSDGTLAYPIEDFLNYIDSDRLIPHDANDYQPPEVRR